MFYHFFISAHHWGPADSKKAKDLSWKMDRSAELKAAGEKHSESFLPRKQKKPGHNPGSLFTQKTLKGGAEAPL